MLSHLETRIENRIRRKARVGRLSDAKVMTAKRSDSILSLDSSDAKFLIVTFPIFDRMLNRPATSHSALSTIAATPWTAAVVSRSSLPTCLVSNAQTKVVVQNQEHRVSAN